MIKALHINSTAPFRAKHKGKKYKIEDFEVLTTILSALMWKIHNGPIKLYCDSVSYSFYEDMGMLDLWDKIDSTTLESMPKDIDHTIFWAASKLFALQNESAPISVIDTDLIMWKPLETKLNKQKLAVIHREGLWDCYMPKELVYRRKGYDFDPGWDWEELPCNCAFTFFNDNKLKDYYTESAIDFMRGNKRSHKNNISQMVFAEQRLLSMCAKKQGINIYALLNDAFDENNDIMTHLWGGKDIARNSSDKCNIICLTLANKIKECFPAAFEKYLVTNAKYFTLFDTSFLLG